MDFVQQIVGAIVRRCRQQRIDADETLAAFVARAVVHENEDRFQLDKPMTEDDVEELVKLSLAKLEDADAPSMQTIRMQVESDDAYVRDEDEAADARKRRDKRLRTLQRDIVAAELGPTGGMETLTTLYRLIFQLLLTDAGADKVQDKAVEREVAAAMESVFPRVGLKTFMELSNVDKKNQLQELARIVLGIRLFNRDIGKGGAGMEDVPRFATDEAAQLVGDISAEAERASEVCTAYTDALVFAHSSRPEDATEEMVAEWKVELTNRRQYTSFLYALLDEAQGAAGVVEEARDSFRREKEELKNLVGSKTSVPKEQVYPKFEALATAWRSMEEQRRVLAAKGRTLGALRPFANLRGTLSEEWITRARDNDVVRQQGAEQGGAAGDTAGAAWPEAGEGKTAEGGEEKGEAAPDAEDRAEGVELLTVESTPEFMSLPLDLQGFCPWTVVQRRGMLLPGNPALGVVQYKEGFFVFSSREAMRAFMRTPSVFLDGVLQAARRSPELIYLLRLHRHFPHVAPHAIMDRQGRGRAAGMEDEQPAMKDAGTETPLHFVEKHIDPDYHWNEWELRRRALRLANLRKCTTDSAQTDTSYFRRESETQVYVRRGKATQTGVNRGTNPPRSVNYVSGLRGGRVHDFEPESQGRPSRYAAGAKPGEAVAVVNLGFELPSGK